MPWCPKCKNEYKEGYTDVDADGDGEGDEIYNNWNIQKWRTRLSARKAYIKPLQIAKTNPFISLGIFTDSLIIFSTSGLLTSCIIPLHLNSSYNFIVFSFLIYFFINAKSPLEKSFSKGRDILPRVTTFIPAKLTFYSLLSTKIIIIDTLPL